VFLEVCDDQLELVEKRFLQNDVLRPDVVLIMGEEIAKLEMLRDSRVLICGGDFDEALGVFVRFSLDEAPSLRARSQHGNRRLIRRLCRRMNAS